MSRYNATLYFKSKQSALDAGYCDAVETGEDDYTHMAVVTFFADAYDVEEDDESLEVDLEMIA